MFVLTIIIFLLHESMQPSSPKTQISRLRHEGNVFRSEVYFDVCLSLVIPH